MMGFNNMMGGNGLSWLIYALVVTLLVLGIAALWKYINKN
ncbi:MAG: hypothetical protein UX44_C0012G0007 [candidate division WWE3 bacterium GW2011_GWA1_46_21]|uniref:Uncharacterized protein n=3 Tax=Katanobacteria TaxID=422282 RepID=A0A0G1PDR5_UNCKA|nr:MAG: hypothetical protein UX44_C0012G0007 [candidate division WWE3 bacterium GW2011_GWA1_46_21]KKU50342.1 MAG: hypothetical protein UX73_C0022G0009 [candidate division WWE3 bacterium GW2011_GWC1_47_10]KKU57126.1 MAG: hypothetical protein UX79_C0020G0011 [candidate division WWE3 bacterium GW2011_GWB1_47_11]